MGSGGDSERVAPVRLRTHGSVAVTNCITQSLRIDAGGKLLVAHGGHPSLLAFVSQYRGSMVGPLLAVGAISPESVLGIGKDSLNPFADRDFCRQVVFTEGAEGGGSVT